MNEWIKVSDKLPTEDGDYLTYVVDNGACYSMEVQRFSFNQRVDFIGGKEYRTHWKLELWDDYLVTHWMPLPSPPLLP